jgi:hypothetical protein
VKQNFLEPLQHLEQNDIKEVMVIRNWPFPTREIHT